MHFIPGPEETFEEFENRSRLSLFSRLRKDFEDFDLIHRDGFLVLLSAKGLKWWEVGALWIYENEAKERFPLIQLKRDSKEIFNHEKVHALRVAFNENRFEELLAYKTSKRAWRQYFGPLFRSQRSVWVFLSSTLLCFAHPIFILFPLIIVSLLALKLSKDQRLLNKTIANIGGFKRALFLTDEEIVRFSKMQRSDILDDLKIRQSESPRICKLIEIMTYKNQDAL